jgi:serine/threonine protein kinase
VNHRDQAPLPPGLEDEDEEKTTIGGAPGDMLAPIAQQSKINPPPRVHVGKNNTPTAFNPQAIPQQAHAPQHMQPQSAPRISANDPPKSQQIQRPGPPALGMTPNAPPAFDRSGDRGSSGPQPVTKHPTPSGHHPSAQQGYPSQPHMYGGSQSPQQPQQQPQMQHPPLVQVQQHAPAPPQFSPQGQQGNPQLGGMQGPGSAVPSPPQSNPSVGFRPDQAPNELRSSTFTVQRERAYSFVIDARGAPVELGSGRFAKVYLGEERWLESKTDFRRAVVIKMLQKGVNEEDHMRFQMEMELLERVQGNPHIVELFASGEGEDPQMLPPSIRDKVEPEFMILEKLDMSLEERLKGSRNRGAKEDLLASDMRERLFRVLDYMIPIASAVEYAHLVRNICHRDIKPANVLVGIPDPNLRGSTLQVRLADFNVAKLSDEEISFGMTQMKASVPGTLFFQSPEQETNVLELLVNVTQGVPEIEYFEDFYIQISKNDNFSLFNRGESYPILYADRARKRLVLARPYRETGETNVRARIQKSVGRPADIYSLGATFYYLISGAYANPKTLYDAFHKFIEYERADENNTIEAYLRHEYSVINSLRAPKTQDGQPEVAPADRFFSYKHYLDGNGELIDPNVMLIIAKCMIRNKPDSYCQAHDLDTRGVSELVSDLINLYSLYGFSPGARPTHLVHRTSARKTANSKGGVFGKIWAAIAGLFSSSKKKSP